MLKFLLVSFFMPLPALAFDPFAAAQGVGLAGKIFSGDVEDAMDIGLSFTGLLEDLDADAGADDQLRKRIEELREVESRLQRTEDSILRTRRVSVELGQATKLRDQIRATREMIRVTKSIAAMMGARPKGAERALKVQDTRLNYMMLDELMAIRRMEYEKAMNDRLVRDRARLHVARIQSEELEYAIGHRGHRNQ